ncbi:uncharacterized protein LY89DRAFT_722671 [Mollisia scopiformis]|uniref:WW domain-containing protein n=1 Tax=Mollisia scopiformis TaxID=149040 RepID=A0A194WVB7_MOLSC|nr:uncharacterized protein LY89DRAFT_722671 [Mollisia scopiformis]KUJ11537.1 hypothetical protein LY89DRAFT_722671 [Mollisia scopiformis]
MSAPLSAPPVAALHPNIPAGWRLEWSAQYHTNYYLNVYTGASTWTVPVEPALDIVRHVQQYSTEEAVPQQSLNVQPTSRRCVSSPSPVSAISEHEKHFAQQTQTVVYTQPEAPALFFPPPPGSSGSEPTSTGPASVQQFLPPPDSSHSQSGHISQHTLEYSPSPLGAHQKDDQLFQPLQNNALQSFPPPPLLPPRSSPRPLSSFLPPPPPHADSNALQQLDVQVQNTHATLDDLHLQTRPIPLTSKPRPRSFIGQMEMMKMQVSEQSHIYGSKVMETKLGTKVSTKVGKLIPNSKSESKETDPLLDVKDKVEKKLWDDRTEEEKKESYKKWGKRAAIGAGVVAAVVIGAEAIEHVANASDAASSVGNGFSSANSAMNSAAANAASINAASNASMMALASAQANAAAVSAGFAAMAVAII